MAKADVIAAALSQFAQDSQQALQNLAGSCYDGGAADQKAADGSSSSPADQATIADLQSKLAAAVAQDQADVASGQQALASLQSSMSDLQAKFDALSQKEGQEASVIQGLQGSLSQMQQVVSILQGILQPPAPAPAPAPVPAPAQGS